MQRSVFCDEGTADDPLLLAVPSKHRTVFGRHPEERFSRRRIRLRSASPSPPSKHPPVFGRHPEERLLRRRIRLRSASPSPTVQASNRFWPSSRGASLATKDLSSMS